MVRSVMTPLLRTASLPGTVDAGRGLSRSCQHRPGLHFWQGQGASRLGAEGDNGGRRRLLFVTDIRLLVHSLRSLPVLDR